MSRGRIRRRADFERAYSQGRSWADPNLAMYVARRDLDQTSPTRAGFTAGKRLGNAVTRNRVRRVMREAFRLLGPYVADGYDIVLVGRRGCVACKLQSVMGSMYYLLRRAGLWRGCAFRVGEAGPRTERELDSR